MQGGRAARRARLPRPTTAAQAAACVRLSQGHGESGGRRPSGRGCSGTRTCTCTARARPPRCVVVPDSSQRHLRHHPASGERTPNDQHRFGPAAFPRAASGGGARLRLCSRARAGDQAQLRVHPPTDRSRRRIDCGRRSEAWNLNQQRHRPPSPRSACACGSSTRALRRFERWRLRGVSLRWMNATPRPPWCSRVRQEHRCPDR